MNTRFKQSIALVIVALVSSSAFAINWSAIEDARNAKHEEKVAAVQQQSKHDLAMQKLQIACDKVKGNAELMDACRAIMDADAEAQDVSK